MTSAIKNLVSNQLVTINGKKGTVFSAKAFYIDLQCEYDEADMDMTNYILQEATCICGDAGYYEAEGRKWAEAVELVNGETVGLDGEFFTIKWLGDYSDMAKLIPVA